MPPPLPARYASPLPAGYALPLPHQVCSLPLPPQGTPFAPLDTTPLPPLPNGYTLYPITLQNLLKCANKSTLFFSGFSRNSEKGSFKASR